MNPIFNPKMYYNELLIQRIFVTDQRNQVCQYNYGEIVIISFLGLISLPFFICQKYMLGYREIVEKSYYLS